MGAWGHGPFDNDAAQDWIGEIVEDDLDAAVRSALEVPLRGGNLELDEGSIAVAAAALVAAALDGETSAVPKNTLSRLSAWKPADELRSLAVRVLDVVSGASSELASLWSGDDAWRASMGRLRTRLQLKNAKRPTAGAAKQKKGKIQPKVGDVFELALGDGRLGFGHVLRGGFRGFYAVESPQRLPIDQIILQPVAFRIVCLSDALENGTWPILGNAVPPPAMNAPMRTWRADALGKRYGYEWHPELLVEEEPVTREYVRGVERCDIWDSREVPRRLSAFLRGEPYPGIVIG